MKKLTMKQAINQKQWGGLTEKQKLKFANTVWIKNGKKTHKLHPPNIGEMIEFLEREVGFNLDYSSLDETWGVFIGEYEKGDKSLCDALWKAVKESTGETK